MSMYQGNNPTAIKSQNWIVTAILNLMKEKPYKQITVKDICEKADLSRQTFYNFFETKEDVLRYCLRTHYEKQYEELAQKDSVTLEDAMIACTTVLDENQNVIRLLTDNQLDSIISDEIARCVELFADHFSYRETNDVRLSYEKVCVSGALSRMVLYWFRSKNPISVNELKDIFLTIYSGQLITNK